MQKITRLFVVGVLGLVAMSCSSDEKVATGQTLAVPSQSSNFISALKTREEPVISDASIAGFSLANPHTTLVSEVTLNKKSIFGRAFLYSATLQVASVYEDDEGEEAKEATDMAAIALGAIPAQFSLFGNKLRLTSDARLDHESDINTPSRLIQEFVVLSQTDDTITIQIDKASPVLETIMSGRKTEAESRVQWIRSVEYASSDDLLLLESSSELRDGGLYEFLETITPRDRWVDSNTKPIFADTELEPLAERFGFLDSGKVFVDHDEKGRIQTRIASRYILKNSEPIKWYVTSNVPEKFYLDVKNGVEAWNRYAPEMGLKELVRFEGKLPEGIKIGDPRYNTIVWDNVAEADSAWESQNADPLTGTQLHSIIYLPLAWFNIGKDYWKDAAGTEDSLGDKSSEALRQLKKKKLLGRKLPISCVEEASAQLNLSSLENEEEFGRELLKGVLFHEVGHALGLDHNFKGSLIFDPESESSLFSTSIMDYNQFNEEKTAFRSLDSSEGPLLEYDRQILAVLYNGGKNLKDNDKELPFCNDEMADSTEDGVDPLCLRYDIGKDPTKRALLSLELLHNPEAKAGRMKSFPHAIHSLARYLPYAKSVESKEAAQKLVGSYLEKVLGTAALYLTVSANSLQTSGVLALHSLFEFQPDTLPEEMEEFSLRDNALKLFEALMPMCQLPEVSRAALLQSKERAREWLLMVPAISTLPEKDREEAVSKILKPNFEKVDSLETKQLSKLRTRWINSLKRSSTAPLAFHTKTPESQEGVDLESLVIKRAEEMTSPLIDKVDRPFAERKAAVGVLLSYAKTSTGKDAIGRVKESLVQEISKLRDSRKRELARKLWETLP